MRIVLAALFAAILAASTAAPVALAADRSVGPETGQARVNENDAGIDYEPEPEPHGGVNPNEIGGGGGNPRGNQWDWCPWWFCR